MFERRCRTDRFCHKGVQKVQHAWSEGMHGRKTPQISKQFLQNITAWRLYNEIIIRGWQNQEFVLNYPAWLLHASPHPHMLRSLLFPRSGTSLSSLPSLRELDLSCNKHLSGGLSHLTFYLAHVAHLESLDLHLCALTRADLEALSECSSEEAAAGASSSSHVTRCLQSRCCPPWRRWRSSTCRPTRRWGAWSIRWYPPSHWPRWGGCRSTAAAWARSPSLLWVNTITETHRKFAE